MSKPEFQQIKNTDALLPPQLRLRHRQVFLRHCKPAAQVPPHADEVAGGAFDAVLARFPALARGAYKLGLRLALSSGSPFGTRGVEVFTLGGGFKLPLAASLAVGLGVYPLGGGPLGTLGMRVRV